MKNSKWRQDNAIYQLDSRHALNPALDAVGTVAEAIRFDFVSPGRDAEVCLILRTPDNTKIITCGTDAGTNISSEELANTLKKNSCFNWPDVLRDGKESGYGWRRNVEVSSQSRMDWDDALEVVVEDAQEFESAGDDVQVCLILRNWDRMRIVTCGTDDITAEGAWNLGTVIRHFRADLKNPARTYNSFTG